MRIHALVMASLCLSAPALATDRVFQVHYEIEMLDPGPAVVSLIITDGNIRENFHVADCASVWPSVTSVNVILDDLDCDGQAVSTSVTEEGLRIEVGSLGWTSLPLEPGRHIVNGIPALIVAR